MKKNVLSIIAIVLVIAMAMSFVAIFTACDNGNGGSAKDNAVQAKPEITLPAYSDIEQVVIDTTKITSDFKIGLICLHDENSTYDKNFINAMKEVQAELGLTNDQVLISVGIPEGNECYDEATRLVSQGCKIIIADSFGHEAHMLKAAKENPNVLFAHATGTTAHTSNQPNFVNAFASIYEGRYIAGVVAGLKLKEMIDNGTKVNGTVVTAQNAKVGYVGAFTYAEVISGYTSFYLGVKSIVPTVTMEVKFTGSWYDETAEKQAAYDLINRGCNLISQHADSMGAPNACEEKGVPNVSYNGSTYKACPTTFLISSRINWAPYYKYLINTKLSGETAVADYVGTIKTGSVELTNLGGAVAEGTLEKVIAVRNQLANGTLKVFDTSTFTVTRIDTGDFNTSMNLNATVDSYDNLIGYNADVDTDEFYTGDTEAIKTVGNVSYFAESEYRSGPYFDLTINGITLLNKKM